MPHGSHKKRMRVEEASSSSHFDLGVKWPKSSVLARKLVSTCAKIGYSGLAFEVEVDAEEVDKKESISEYMNNLIAGLCPLSNLQSLEAAEVGKDDILPGQSKFEKEMEELGLANRLASLKVQGGEGKGGPRRKFLVLRKVVVIVRHPSHLGTVKQILKWEKEGKEGGEGHASELDLVCVRVEDDSCLRKLCGLETHFKDDYCDMLQFDFASENPPYIKKTLITAGTRGERQGRGYVLEFPLSYLFRDLSRKVVLENMRELVCHSPGAGGRGLVCLTSGAAKETGLRTPSDMQNVASALLGVSLEGRCVTGVAALQAISKGVSRRGGDSGVVFL